MNEQRKGQALGISSLATAAIAFVVIAIVIVVGLDLITDVRDENPCRGMTVSVWNDTTDYCCFTLGNCEANTTHRSAANEMYNSSVDGIGALANLSSKMDLLATAVILGIIIAVLLRVFKVV